MPFKDPAQIEWDEIRKIDHYARSFKDSADAGSRQGLGQGFRWLVHLAPDSQYLSQSGEVGAQRRVRDRHERCAT
jgi:hypothetical protein